MSFEITKTRRGLRLEQNGCVLSEILSAPGPTNSVFDFLACAARILAPGPRWALLGFAGGGLIAPLRCAESEAEIHAVDLSPEGFRLFEETCGEWSGKLRFTEADAATWLAAQPGEFDVIIEDLSVPTQDDVIKPGVSTRTLPSLMPLHLSSDGVMVTNVLKPKGTRWDEMLTAIRTPGLAARLVHLREFENKILLQARELPGAARISRRLRRALEDIGSDQAEPFRVTTLN